jgi:hypothetical protein
VVNRVVVSGCKVVLVLVVDVTVEDVVLLLGGGPPDVVVGVLDGDETLEY